MLILLAGLIQGASSAFSQALPALPSTDSESESENSATSDGSVETRLFNLEEQNRLLMEQNRQLSEQLELLSRQYQEINGRLTPAEADVSDLGGAGARDNPAGPGFEGGPSDRSFADISPAEEATTDLGGAGARDNVPEPEEAPSTGPRRFPLGVNFGPGFELMTEDEEFRLQFHNETQIEYRAFNNTGQGTVHNGFFMPRQIWWMNGRITKPVEFFTAFQKGLGAVNVRDAFINIRPDDRLMFKVGRYKPPFTYEFYATSNQDMLQPERSLFAINFGDNRELGAMLWGELFDERLDYAVGVFNGPRASFEDFNDAKNVNAYLHYKPFAKSERFAFLENFGVGGSLDSGRQDHFAFPRAIRTSVSASESTGASTASPAFLIFNNGVLEDGLRNLWNLHAVYFYKGLSIQAEWDSGFADYSRGPGIGPRVRVPIHGYYVAAGYFLTGESVPRRTQVEVLRPLSFKPGERGIGAVEVQARYAALSVGREVFTGGLADSRLWANSAQTFETGLNWHPNNYLKFYIEWHHTGFGQPVIFRQGTFHKSSDMIWIRMQLYF